MAGFQHKTVGTALTQAEYEQTDTSHQFASQATGMLLYASSSTVNTSLAIGATGQVLQVSGGIPAWTSQVRIPNGGDLVVGHTAQETISTDGSTDLVPEVQVLGTAASDASILIASFSATATIAGSPVLAFAKGGHNTIGSHTVVTSGEELGNIVAYGDDGTDLESIAAQIQFESDGTPGTGDMPGRIVFATTADGSQAATERLRINSSGDLHIANGGGLVVGHTAQETISIGDGGTDLVPEVQVLGTAQADSSIMLATFSTTATSAGAPLIALVKGGNASIGSHTIVVDGEELGNIIAFGDDGTDLESVAAQIQFEVDGTPGTGDMPGRIIFATTADGAETATEKMRIASDGTVTLTSVDGGATGPILNLFHDTGSASATGGQDNGDRLGVIDFLDTDGVIRGEISCALEGNTSQAGFHFRLAGDATNDKLYITRDGNATLLGTLTESSDERLKANVATLTGSLAKVKQMRGVSFTRNDLTDKTQTHLGLIAQELELVAAELVSTGANGFKAVAYSQLSAYLIEAIKELDTRIAALE